MTLTIVLAIIGIVGAAISATFFRRGGIYNPIDPEEPMNELEAPILHVETVTPPSEVIVPKEEPEKLLWDTPKQAFHSVRVLCDEWGLTVPQKNEICETIYGESEFNNNAVCRNKNSKGIVTSSDWGICQINDYWHCGKGKRFSSSEYVVAHPEEAVKFMIEMYKAGQIDLWVAHKSGAYKKFIPKSSKMWELAKV